MAAKKRLLPFFIPMAGCPHRCIYCDQHSISGRAAAPDIDEIKRKVASLSDEDYQVAFYGGSFTALARPYQEQLLQAVEQAAGGKKLSVRVSTRPDYIDDEAAALLAAHGVTTVELGVQSFDAAVLAASGRHYQSETVKAAVYLLRQKGFEVIIQLMTGLPLSNDAVSLADTAAAIGLQPQGVRIYPLLVIEGTPLAELYQSGAYRPQTLDEAVGLAAKMQAMFDLADIPVIRAGLNPSAQLEAALIDGPYHPAFGHLLRCRLKKEQALQLIGEQKGGSIGCPKKELPLLTGQNGATKRLLQQDHGIEKLCCDDLLSAGDLSYLREGKNTVLQYKKFLREYLG